jgi:hypothetical protein
VLIGSEHFEHPPVERRDPVVDWYFDKLTHVEASVYDAQE